MCVCARARAYVRVGMCMRVLARVRAALLIQHGTCIRHIVTSFVAPLAPPHFSTLSHKQHELWKKGIKYKICVLIFCTMFV